MTRFENVLIRASAGTGKTFQLSNRYIGLMEA
ncbi:MAG: ATP-dependent exoDNAse (exonuclease V) beta subunit, partial [Pirellulaceae bacterium]